MSIKTRQISAMVAAVIVVALMGYLVLSTAIEEHEGVITEVIEFDDGEYSIIMKGGGRYCDSATEPLCPTLRRGDKISYRIHRLNSHQSMADIKILE